MATYTGPADANGFKVKLTYTVTPKADNSGWTINMYESLIATTSGKYFTSWTLTCYCGVSESSTPDATAHKQFSIPNLGTIDLTTAKNFSVLVESAGGTPSAPTATLYGYCDADTNATYVPVNNSISKVISLPVLTPSFTVTYSNAYGSNGTTTQSVLQGSTGTFPDPGTRANYTFAGWDWSYSAGTQTPSVTADITYTAQWTPVQIPVTFNNSYGSNGTTSQNVGYGLSTTFPSPGTRPGYSFTGWNNNSSYYVGATTPTVYSATSYSADYGWVVLSPGFVDESVTSQLYINQTIESTANYTVSATNTTSYSIQAYGAGLNPMSWLTINASTGALSGSTNVPGTYTFRVAATGISTTTYSNVITVTVVYPGKRTNSTFGQAPFETAKRFDGGQWIPLTSMKRWDGSAWVNLSN